MEQDALLTRETLEGLSDVDALWAIGRLVDIAHDCQDPDLTDKALRWADELDQRGLTAGYRTQLDYFRANAWASRYHARVGDRAAIWAWDVPELQQQIFLLRRSRYNSAFAELPPLRRCEILTNLANVLDTVGRFIEARAIYSEALDIEPDFWMSRGNRAVALIHYARSHYDPGQAQAFAFRAHQELLQTLGSIERQPSWGASDQLTPYFTEWAAKIGGRSDRKAFAASYDPNVGSLGDSQEEQAYRRWCLRRQLFLNPLNDVETAAIAARDILNLPSFTTGIDEPPVVVGFFNQLKQEYASARWLFYSAQERGEPHFSDRQVSLLNTLDYPAYGLAIEKMKMAFRMAYSLFDKIAYFLNHYLKLGIPERAVSFRSLWRDGPGKPVREKFLQSENWPLRGLYWLSKDLFEEELREVTDPEARELNSIRNHLEHKYLKVHEMTPPPAPQTPRNDPFFDSLAYSVRRTDLEDSTLKLLKLARSALIYLSLGMHREESRRESGQSCRVQSMPMLLDEYDDDWKR